MRKRVNVKNNIKWKENVTSLYYYVQNEKAEVKQIAHKQEGFLPY